MFETITESGGRRRRSIRTAFVATIAHGLLVAAAVSATQPNQHVRDDAARDARIVFVPPPPVAAARPTEPLAPAPSAPAAPVLPALPDLAIVPVGIASPHVPDLSVLTGPRAPTAVAAPATGVLSELGAGRNTMTGDVLSADMVDEVVAVIRQRAPRYPRELERAGAGGRVVLEFVVDSAGRVEPASVRVVESSAEAFDEAAREAVLEARFRPARAAGHAVRQLVRQAMTFVSR